MENKLDQPTGKFQDPLTTVAAIDRVVHHSVILEFGSDLPSLRAAAAAQRQQAERPARAGDPPGPAPPPAASA